jgi:hypothetical protein
VRTFWRSLLFTLGAVALCAFALLVLLLLPVVPEPDF